jgi:hypothetical protein
VRDQRPGDRQDAGWIAGIGRRRSGGGDDGDVVDVLECLETALRFRSRIPADSLVVIDPRQHPIVAAGERNRQGSVGIGRRVAEEEIEHRFSIDRRLA